jgi:hypothetical protein
MMGEELPKTCWATHKRQVINLWNCCILLVNLFESNSYDWYQDMERGMQKPADPLYDKAECAAGETMADASSMLG